jgi:hypothetical protein
MQTDVTLETTPDVALSEPEQIDPFNQALGELQSEVRKLEAAFAELSNLQAEKETLEHALAQAGEDERAVLSDTTLSESQGVKRLTEARARRDLRQERLIEHKKRIASYCDLLLFDIAEPLRRSFAIFANELLVRTERRIQELVDSLWPYGSVAFDSHDLVRSSVPVKKLERIGYAIAAAPPKDPAAALEELKRLPREWLDELRAIVQVETNERTS